jgi:hypothetical protein
MLHYAPLLISRTRPFLAALLLAHAALNAYPAFATAAVTRAPTTTPKATDVAPPADKPAPKTNSSSIPVMIPPIACNIGQDCWISGYMGHKAKEDATESLDYKCGFQTSGDQISTDFTLRDLTQQRQNIAILAPADGKIIRLRNLYDDAFSDDEKMESLKQQNKGCGNGLVIDHGEGWQSVFCHIQKDSFAVKEGDTVTTGQNLANVGYSGATQQPMLHFSVFHNQKPVDPFIGPHTPPCMSTLKTHTPPESLWVKGLDLPYEPISIIAAGFRNNVPSKEDLQEDSRNIETLRPTSSALVFYGIVLNPHQGDRIDLTIKDPNGHIIAQREFIETKQRQRQNYYVGINNKATLPEGSYTGTIKLVRTPAKGPEITKSISRALYIQ